MKPALSVKDKKDFERYNQLYEKYKDRIPPATINYITCIKGGRMDEVEPLLEDIAKKLEPKPCVWKTGSTNPETGKAEIPTLCKEKGCDGNRRGCGLYEPMTEPLCEKR